MLNFFQRPFDRLALVGVGAEIGVYRGQHAAQLLARHHEITKLFLVDPYVTYDDKQISIEELRMAQTDAHMRLEKFNGKSQFVLGDSSLLQNELSLGVEPYLDFAYIDGDHREPAVAFDIERVWPLIKRGGIMGGHDFHPDWPGVVNAVTKFAVKCALELCVETPDWWIVKP